MNKKNFVFYLLFLFSFIISQIEFIDISLEETNFSKIYRLNDYKKYNITNNYKYDYLRIKVEGGELNKNTNHIIYFFGHDSNFTERKQLSQSVDGTTLMILNNLEMKDFFYLGIECAKKPCSYILNINGSFSFSELFVGEQINCCVTNENEIMKFSFRPIPVMNTGKRGNIISVWAKGNKIIEHNLLGGNSKAFSSFPYYRIDLSDFKNNNYIFTVKGKKGDFINIGSFYYKRIFWDKYIQYASEVFFNFNGLEMSGYATSLQTSIFKVNENVTNLCIPNSLNNNFHNLYLYRKRPNSDKDLQDHLISRDEESFYSFQFLKDTQYDGQGNNKYLPQLFGVYYQRSIQEETTIGLISMEPENFNYITFEIFPIRGEIRFSIFECHEYPL